MLVDRHRQRRPLRQGHDPGRSTPHFWTKLDDAQRAIITKASDATRSWAIANQMKDAEAAARFCAGRRHRRPGRCRLHRRLPRRRSPGLRRPRGRPGDEARDRRDQGPSATGTSAAPSQACEPVIDATTLVPDGGDLPNGIYRIEATEAYLKAATPTTWAAPKASTRSPSMTATGRSTTSRPAEEAITRRASTGSKATTSIGCGIRAAAIRIPFST